MSESDKLTHPADIYLFKDNNRNTRKRYETCSKLIINTVEQRQRRCLGVFINFKHFTPFSSVSIANLEQVNVSWAFIEKTLNK